jgi:hypothetical protein
MWKTNLDCLWHGNCSVVGITMSGKPEAFTGVPVPTLLPWRKDAWTKSWTGSGYFLPSGNKWFHDQDSPAIPRESLMFYNEEDWIKFKFMTENQSLPNNWSRDLIRISIFWYLQRRIYTCTSLVFGWLRGFNLSVFHITSHSEFYIYLWISWFFFNI